MSRALPKLHRRRIIVFGAVGGTLCATVAVGAAMASQEKGSAPASTTAASQTIVCPSVEGSLPAVPASAQAEVDRNLALLQTQLDEANNRLVTSAGEGGANFVQNAILGPLEDKRVAALNRIETAIGRAADKPEGLEQLAPCELQSGDAAGGAAGDAAGDAAAAPGEAAGAEDTGAADTGAADDAAAGASDDAADDAAATGSSISCPDVASQVGTVPAGAQAEVDRNLALLQTQLDEANNRLATSAGQGGPNFVQNAILGPLADKRKSTIDRIVISISRQGATAPSGLDALAGCTLS